jgi:hypothetical protein
MAAVKLELSVPSSLDSIELWQYQKYMSVVEKNKDVENAEEFLNMKLVEIFCDISLKDVSSINLKDFDKISKIIATAFNEETPLVRHFELDGVEFGFIPNLDKVSIGEYIDAEAGVTGWKNMHKAMAVLFRPVTKKYKDKYQIEKYDAKQEYQEVMKYMPLNVALGALVFFYRLGKDLSSHTLNSLEKEMEENKTIRQQVTSELGGGGISRYTDLLEEKFSTLTGQLKFLHTKL